HCGACFSRSLSPPRHDAGRRITPNAVSIPLCARSRRGWRRRGQQHPPRYGNTIQHGPCEPRLRTGDEPGTRATPRANKPACGDSDIARPGPRQETDPMPLQWTISHPKRLVVAVAKGEMRPQAMVGFLRSLDDAGARPYAKLVFVEQLITTFNE